MTSLNKFNYLNVVATCIVLLHTINIDLGPDYDFFNRFNLSEFSRRYNGGSMTPAEPFFLIFNVVSLFLFVFTVVQLLPTYRALPMVQEGVGYWYFASVVAQVLAHTFSIDDMDRSFVLGLISTLFFGVMCFCSWKILNLQAHAIEENPTEEYWILRFPFGLQAGWSIALVIMSANVLFRGEDGGFSAVMNTIIIILSLAAYFAIPLKLLFFNGEKPNYVVPPVIALVTFGIGLNIGNEEADWATITLLITVYGICFFAAMGTMYKVYMLELRKTAESEEAESEYHAAELTSMNEAVV